MTASECPLLPALTAWSPGADGMVQVADVDPARLLDMEHAVQFVDVATVLPAPPPFVRLLSYPAVAAAR